MSEKSLQEIKNVNLKAYTKLFVEILEVSIFDEMLLNSFVRDIEIIEVTETYVAVAFNSNEAMEFCKREYKLAFQKAAEDIFQKNLEVKYLVKGQTIASGQKTEVVSKNLVKKFTLENYVEAEFNQDAVKIARKIVEKPGKYSPFFVASKSGLGKTHLLQALGNKLTENGQTCYYVEPNLFTKRITELSGEGGMSITNFADDLKKYDVLIFDDIQNLGDRSVTLKVLFEIINHHIEHGKQIIIASDKTVKELSGFEARFITRFSSGLTSIIKEPTIDDLVKVLEKKLTWANMGIERWEREALRFIARNNSSSIRSLEGAIKRVAFYTENESNIQYTNKVIQNIFKELEVDPSELTPQRIIDTVSHYYKINVANIIGKSRKKEYVMPRHMAIWLIKKIINNIPLAEIGRLFSNRDHTTILAALKKIDTDIEIDRAVKLAADKIEQNIKMMN